MAKPNDVVARLALREAKTSARAFRLLAAGVGIAAVFSWLFAHWLAIEIAASSFAMVTFCLAFLRKTEGRRLGSVCVYDWGVTRDDEFGSVRLVAFSEPFGVTLLADHSRSHALLAFTTHTHTRFVSVHTLNAPSGLLSLATTIAESDAVAIKTPFALDPHDALLLLRCIKRRDPRANERLFLSGSRGEKIVLERHDLRIDKTIIDLRSPLEWRGFMFHESNGPVTTLYQATWVKQGTSELVFVAPMPHVLASHSDRHGAASGDEITAVLHDLKLMQSALESPPPRELRTAIERAFMLVVRHALDRAPRVARNPSNQRLTSSPDHV